MKCKTCGKALPSTPDRLYDLTHPFCSVSCANTWKNINITVPPHCMPDNFDMKCYACGKKLPHHYMITAAGFNVCGDDCRRKSEGGHLHMNKTTDGYPAQESEHDPVNHPSHYTSHPSGVECITITRHMTFNIGNVIKYVWWSGLKGEAPAVQDLKKAAFYLNDEIKRIEEQQNKTV